MRRTSQGSSVVYPGKTAGLDSQLNAMPPGGGVDGLDGRRRSVSLAVNIDFAPRRNVENKGGGLGQQEGAAAPAPAPGRAGCRQQVGSFHAPGRFCLRLPIETAF